MACASHSCTCARTGLILSAHASTHRETPQKAPALHSERHAHGHARPTQAHTHAHASTHTRQGMPRTRPLSPSAAMQLAMQLAEREAHARAHAHAMTCTHMRMHTPLQVGAHTDRLDSKRTWLRLPAMVSSFPVGASGNLTVGNAVGGLLFLVVPPGSSLGMLQVIACGRTLAAWRKW